QVPGLHDRVLARTPAARWGVPGDFSGIAVFLASPASDFLTGTAIPVDGGYSVMAGWREASAARKRRCRSRRRRPARDRSDGARLRTTRAGRSRENKHLPAGWRGHA